MEEKKPKRRISIISILLIAIIVIIVVVIAGKSAKSSDSKEGVVKEEKQKGYLKLVKSEDGVFTYIDNKQKVHQYKGYVEMNDFWFNTTCVIAKDENDDRVYKIINNKEKVIVAEGVYDFIGQTKNGRFYKVEKDNKEGVIDYEGKIVIPLQYSYIADHFIGDEDQQNIFCCKNANDEYEYYTETGNLIVTLKTHEMISYYNNREDSAAMVKIKDKIYNSLTGEEMYETKDITGSGYGIVLHKKQYDVYDKKLNLVESVEFPNATSINIEKYGEYIVMEVSLSKDATEEEKARKYNLYDSNSKLIKKSETQFILHKIPNGKMLILEERDNDVVVSDIDSKELFVIESHRLPASYTESMYITVPQRGDKLYDVYNTKGKSLFEKGIRSEAIKFGGTLDKDYMVITRNNKDGNYDAFVLLPNMEEIQVEKSVNMLQKNGNNILTSNWDKKIVKLYKGSKQVGDDIAGTYNNQIGNYSLIKLEDSYEVINLADFSIGFTFDAKEFVKVHEDIDVIELKSGYYDVKGQLLVEKSN